MSGKKELTVPIEQSRLENLLRKELELSKVNIALADDMENVREEIRDELHNLSNILTQRISSEVKELGDDFQQMKGDLTEKIKSVHQETIRLFQEQSQQFEVEIDAIKDRVNSFEEINRLTAQESGRRIKVADEQVEFISSHYRHDFFAPGELVRLQSRLIEAKSAAENQQYTVALSGVKEVLFTLNEMQQNLELCETEWNLSRIAVIEKVEIMLKTLNQNKHVNAFDLDGNLLSDILDVNFWTEGKLELLQNDAVTIRKTLDTDRYTLTQTDLERISYEDISAINERLCELVKETRLRALASQVRFDIMESLCDCLYSQGFALDDIGIIYENDDFRKGVLARLLSYDNAEIILRVVPIEDFKYKIEINSFDYNRLSEHQLQKRCDDMSSTFSEKYGIQIHNDGSSAEPNSESKIIYASAVQRTQRENKKVTTT